jgi:hypothetical protein
MKGLEIGTIAGRRELGTSCFEALLIYEEPIHQDRNGIRFLIKPRSPFLELWNWIVSSAIQRHQHFLDINHILLPR